MVTVFGTHLWFETRTVDLGQPVSTLLELPDLVVALTERDSDPPRSVYGLDPDGTRRWQIEAPSEEPPGDRGLYYTDAWVAGGELWVRCTSRYTYRVSLDDGQIVRRVPETEVPLPNGTVNVDRPVGKFVRSEDLTVALLDHTQDSDGSFGEPPGPRNVVAFSTDGTERWRIEDLALEDRTNELWTLEDSPRPLRKTNAWADLQLEDGALVVEHKYGTEATVDPTDGSITVRGVSYVDDRLVFGDAGVHQLSDPVWTLDAVGNVVLVVLGTHRESANWGERNVLAFDRDGTKLWRIEGRDDETIYVDTIWTIGDDVLVRRPDGVAYEVDLASGDLRSRYEPNQVPLGSTLLTSPQEVRSVATDDGTVAVCLNCMEDAPSFDVDADDDEVVTHEPVPAEANVLAFDETGQHRWRIEPAKNTRYTGVGHDGDTFTATTWDGRHLDVHPQTGRTSRNTNVLW